MRQSAGQPRHPASAILALIVATSLAGAACDAGVPQRALPSASGAAPSATARPSDEPTDSSSPTPVIAPDARLAGLVPGALAVTVSDNLRVRSKPGVSITSLKYTPLLPIGTPLVVAAGPVKASGYDWFRVAPVGVKLSGGVDQGWVAVADHDGTPWVGLSDDPTPGFELAAAAVDRPDPSLAAARAEATALNAFGVALYKRLLKDPIITPAGKGIVFSPASIATALAMARAGARGDTATEMDRVMGVDSWASLSDGLSSLESLLLTRDATWTVEYEDDATHRLALRMANMAFGQEGYAIEQGYLDRLARTFGSGLGLVDYINETSAARATINAWVSRQTLGRIPELLKPPNVRVDTRLVLVNAIYLKAEWARAFDSAATTARTFTTAAGKAIQVPTMQVTGEQDIVIASGDGWKATELRYMGPDGTTPLAMTLILPDRLASFERQLSAKNLAAIQARIAAERERIETATFGPSPEDCGTYPYNVRLFLPKFGLDTGGDLVPSLEAMGMRRAVDAALADFSGITTTDPLFISAVIHEANIDVDEKGTEASAATAVIMETGGCTGPNPAKTRTLRFNRPFLFVLRDVQTNAILFMGRTTDPSQR